MLFLYIGPERAPGWLPSTIRLPNDADVPVQRRITLPDDGSREDSMAAEIEGLNADSRLASEVERGRSERYRDVPNEQNRWAE